MLRNQYLWQVVFILVAGAVVLARFLLIIADMANNQPTFVSTEAAAVSESAFATTRLAG